MLGYGPVTVPVVWCGPDGASDDRPGVQVPRLGVVSS
jgi:hypothetical protein